MTFTRAISLTAALMLSPMLVKAAELPNAAAIKQKLSDNLGLEVVEVQKAPLDGLYQAITDRGVIYVSKDGSKLFHGNIYDMDQGMTNLTEAALAGPRKEMIKPFEKDMIVYKAKNQKHVVTIFTDVSCGYCRKLHNQMDQYNDLGITVRYLAFPRQGVPSANADDMRSIWCAKNPLQAMNDAQNGKSVPLVKCNAKIAEQYKLGGTIGVSGTPAIVLEDGSLVPGYQPPADLLRTLESRGE